MNDIKSLINNLQNVTTLRHADTPLIRWSLLAIAFISAWLWFIQPLHGLNDSLQEQIAQNANKAVRLTALKEQAEQWAETEHIAITTLEQATTAYFTGNSATAAQANVQALIKQQTTERNLSIESQKVMPAEIGTSIGTKLPIAMNIRGDLANVLLLLDNISQLQQIIQIDQWVIRMGKNNQAILQVTISGFMASNNNGSINE